MLTGTVSGTKEAGYSCCPPVEQDPPVNASLVISTALRPCSPYSVGIFPCLSTLPHPCFVDGTPDDAFTHAGKSPNSRYGDDPPAFSVVKQKTVVGLCRHFLLHWKLVHGMHKKNVVRTGTLFEPTTENLSGRSC